MVSRGPRPAHRRQTVGRPYRRLQAWVFATQTHCWICGNPVDKALPHLDPQTGLVNRQSKSLDHVVPCSVRPELALDRNNARLAHFGCNSSRGDGTKRMRRRPAPALVTAVSW